MLTDILDAVKEAGHVKYGNVGQESNLGSRILNYKGNITIFAGLKQLTVTADNTVGINLNTHFSVREA